MYGRGKDFIRVQDFHPPCTEDYYKECIEMLGKDRQYLVISDDIEWCKTVFTGSNFHFNQETPEGLIKGTTTLLWVLSVTTSSSLTAPSLGGCHTLARVLPRESLHQIPGSVLSYLI